MSIIEQAARRLEQLERAGVAVPTTSPPAPGERESGEPSATGKLDLKAATSGGGNKAAGASTNPAPAIEAAVLGASARPGMPAARVEPRTRVELNLAMLRDAGYLVPDQVRSELAEQFRHLKRPLLRNARAASKASGDRSALIMVTSALPGEGKTFCAINLAMSMAMEVDTGVILVDADVVRPNVFARLGIDMEVKPAGLLDVLTRDDIELQDAIVETNVPKLRLMASGDRSRRSTELLASAAMDALLSQLAIEYQDHVLIFDAPPLLLTTESPVLASKVGQVVVVVEAAKTPLNTVRQAFAALQHCPIVLSVLNKCDGSSEGRRYGDYYG